MKVGTAVVDTYADMRLMDFTQFFAEFAYGAEHVAIGASVNSLLRHFAQRGYDYCVLQGVGHHFLGPRYQTLELLRRLVETLPPNFLVAGHIIDEHRRAVRAGRNDAPPDGTYSLFHSCALLNLRCFRRLGMPDFGRSTATTAVVIRPTRDAGNVHDDYTPLSLTDC